MQIIVTGSIAFDYLMSFPGKFTEHFLPEHFSRVSLSFLVDTMDKRRGGCAPNIAYTLALLGERPRLMATAGQDFGDYRRWLDAAGVDTSLVREVSDKFTASFFCSTDQANNQIASFYTGAMAHAAELSFRTAGQTDLVIISPNDPAAMTQYAAECRTLGIPYIFDPGQQCARMNGDELTEGIVGAYLVICNDYEMELIREKTQMSEADILRTAKVLVITRGEHGSSVYEGSTRAGRAGSDAASDCRSDRRRRCVPRRAHEGPCASDGPHDLRTYRQCGGRLCARTSRRNQPLLLVAGIHGAVRAALRSAAALAGDDQIPGRVRSGVADPAGCGDGGADSSHRALGFDLHVHRGGAGVPSTSGPFVSYRRCPMAGLRTLQLVSTWRRPRARSQPSLWDAADASRPSVAWLAAAAMPTAVTFVIEKAGIAAVGNGMRFVAALPLGLALAWVIVRTASASRRIE